MLSPISALGDSARVLFADAYGDGTVWFNFKGNEGRYAEVCIDGRKGSPTRPKSSVIFDLSR
jgi:hypothetical protein